LILYLIVLPTVLLHIAYAGCRVLMSLFALQLGASPFTVGIILSLIGVLPILFAITAGQSIDRIGVRIPMLAGAGMVSASLLLAVAVPRVEILFIVSPLVGAGFVIYHIAVNHAAGVLGLPEDRVKNFSLMALTFSTSGFLGPTITGFAIDLIGYRYTFLLLATSAAIPLAMLLMMNLETPRYAPGKTHGKSLHVMDLLRDRTMRRVFIISSALSVGWDLFTFVVPIHGSRIGLSASQIGLILGAFGVAVFAVRLALPLFAHRVSEWQMMVTAMITTGVMLFLFPLTHHVPLLVLMAFLLGIGLGGAQPMIMTLLYQHAPPGRGGEAVGMRTLLININQTGIPLMFGALGAALGMTPVFWTMAILLAGSGYLMRKP
jgi:predicted MFS family arabinose efflux permease